MSPRRYVVTRLRCSDCGHEAPVDPPRSFEVGCGGLGPHRSYRVNVGSPIEAVDWRVFPELRCRCRLAHELKVASTRIDALDRFARWAGGILENMFVSYSLTPEKDELKKLVDQYHKLFPSVSDDLEF